MSVFAWTMAFLTTWFVVYFLKYDPKENISEKNMYLQYFFIYKVSILLVIIN